MKAITASSIGARTNRFRFRFRTRTLLKMPHLGLGLPFVTTVLPKLYADESMSTPPYESS